MSDFIGFWIRRLKRPARFYRDITWIRPSLLSQTVEIANFVSGQTLSYTLSLIGRHYDAIAAMETAIEFDPHSAPFRVHLGNQLQVVERYEDAASAYQAALALYPANRDAERRLRDLRTAYGRRQRFA